MAGWPKLDPKWLWELGFYLLEDFLYFSGVIDQGTDWSREQTLDELKLICQVSRLLWSWYFCSRGSQTHWCWVKGEQIWNIKALWKYWISLRAKCINGVIGWFRIDFCSVTCSEKEVMVGPSAIVSVEFEETIRALAILAYSSLLALLKYPFYPLFILDNGMNSISKSLTVLTRPNYWSFSYLHIYFGGTSFL